MAVDVTLFPDAATIGDVVDYSVQEDATPLVIGESNGSVGQVTVTARAVKDGPVGRRSGGATGATLVLTDDTGIDHTDVKGRGTITGQVVTVAQPGARAVLTVDTVMNRFNTERKAKAFFGSYFGPQTSLTQRTNYAPNPGRDVNLTNVTHIPSSGGTSALTRVTTGGVDGGPFARVTWSASATGSDGGVYDTIPGLTGGVSYTFSGHYRATRAVNPGPTTIAQSMRYILRFFNSGGGQVGSDLTSTFALYQGMWERPYISAVAPAGAVSAQLHVSATISTGFSSWKVGDTFDADGIMVEQGNLGTYFSGSTPATDETDPYTTIRTQRTHAWVGAVGNSASTELISTTTPPQGYDATQGAYFRYLCDLVGLYNVSVDPEFDNKAVAYPGWEGNVWKYVKDFCSANRAEVALVDGVVVLRKPRIRKLHLESGEGLTVNVTTAHSAQFVEVYNYNSRWGTAEPVLWLDSVPQVETSGFTELEVSFPHFIYEFEQPQAVVNFAREYDAGSGQYSVLDSQGVAVSPQWWDANGGRVVIEPVYDDANRALVRIYGPVTDTNSYLGPFRIGRILDDEAFAALTITGSGVFIDQQVVRVRTGVSSEQTSTEVDSIIDNVFLSNANLAYTRALDAACAAAGPTVTLTGSIPRIGSTDGQEFGLIAGSMLEYRDNLFRLTRVNVSRDSIQFDAVAAMTFGDIVDLYSYTFNDFNAAYAGTTFATFNTVMSGKTFAQFNSTFGNVDFAAFNAVYAGTTFSSHAVYPYVSRGN